MVIDILTKNQSSDGEAVLSAALEWIQHLPEKYTSCDLNQPSDLGNFCPEHRINLKMDEKVAWDLHLNKILSTLSDKEPVVIDIRQSPLGSLFHLARLLP